MQQQTFMQHLEKITRFNSQHNIMLHCLEISKQDGLNLEFGVFKGHTINLCAIKQPNRTFYGFDSFEGLPEDWRKGFLKGHFNLNGFLPNVNSNVKLVKGLFSDTLQDFLDEHKEHVSYVHIDCDLYSSTKYVLETLKDRFVVGTVLLFDEFYNYPGWEEGEFKAWMEFAENNSNFEYEFLGYNINHEQVAIKITKV